MKLYDNERQYLEDGTFLLPDLQIKTSLSFGGTSLVYKAYDSASNCFVIVKEFFPKNSVCRIIREGLKLRTQDGDDGVIRAAIKKRAEREVNIATYAVKTENDSNSIHSFPGKDITDMVCKDEKFAGTLARYIVYYTVEGKTLYETCNKTGLLNNEKKTRQKALDALYLSYAAILAVKYQHERGVFCLDLQEKNLYFPTQINDLSKTFCILLDYGAWQTGEYDLSLGTSESERSSPELRRFIKYALSGNGNLTKRYKEFISAKADVYSIGAVLANMILTSDVKSSDGWKKVFGDQVSGPKEVQKTLMDLIAESLEQDCMFAAESLCECIFNAIRFDVQVVTSGDPTKARYGLDELENAVRSLIEICSDVGIHAPLISRNIEKSFESVIKSYGVPSVDSINEDMLAYVEETN